MAGSIFIVILMLVFSAFFSGMEIAYVSSNKVDIEIEKKQDNFIGRLIKRMTRKPSKFITTMLLGTNIALVIYGIYMGGLLMRFIPLGGITGIVVQTIISTFIILITAEFLPKVFFRLYANSMLKIFAVPAYFFYTLLNFFSSFVMWISDGLLNLLVRTKGDEVRRAFTKMELGNYINEQMETVENQEEVDSEVLIFRNALKFSDIKTREVMIPRTEIIAVDQSTDPRELIAIFEETGLSKVLVYKENIEDIIGYIHSFELFKRPNSVKSILLPVIYVPETMRAKEVLNGLVKKRISVAVVIDEYGGTSGMITVEDIVEELFGEIEDEHDTQVLVEENLGGGRFKFSARAEIDYINETYKINLPKSSDYETLGGLMVHYTEEIPDKGGSVKVGDYILTVLEVSTTKIELIQLEPQADNPN